jgi:hypothetical protein
MKRINRDIGSVVGFTLAMVFLAALPASSHGATTAGYPGPSTATPWNDEPTPAPPVTPGVPDPSPGALLAKAYVEQQYDIPLEALVVITDHRTDYAHLRRQYQAVTLIDNRAGGVFYHLLVDLENDEVTEDIAAVDSADAAARIARFGKLDPVLYEHLQTIQDEDAVAVIIWVAPIKGQVEAAVAAVSTLEARYPEVAEAVARGTKPEAIEDRALAAQVTNEHFALMKEIEAERARPLLEA